MIDEPISVVTMVSDSEAECDCGEVIRDYRLTDAIQRHSVVAHGGIQLLVVRAPS